MASQITHLPSSPVDVAVTTAAACFSVIAARDQPSERRQPGKLVAPVSRFIGFTGLVMSVPLLIVEAGLLATGLTGGGFSLPPAVLRASLLVVVGSIAIWVLGSLLLIGKTQARRWPWSVLRVLLQAGALVGVAVFTAGFAVTVTWSHLGNLADSALPAWFFLVPLLAAFVLFVAASFERGSGPGSWSSLVGSGLFNFGWIALYLSLLTLPGVCGLLQASFADSVTLLPFLAGALAGPMILVAGAIVRSPRKRLVLFLRKFGSDGINASVQRAVRTGLDQRFRLVTLDDASFKPLGSPPDQTLGLLAAVISILVAGLASIKSLFWTMDRLNAGMAITTDIWVPGAIDGMEGWYYERFLTAVISGAVLVCGFIVLVGLAAAAVIYLMTRRTRLTILEPQQLSRLQRLATALTGRLRSPSLLAPRASVVRVTDALWQAAVGLLLSRSSIVLMDISIPSESILWELREILVHQSAVPILVAQADQLDAWLAQLDDSPMFGSTLDVVRGLPLLRYSSPESLDVQALAREMTTRVA